MELTVHLFRHEAGRTVAVLTRLFGVHNLALAEDVVQDAFCRALEVWAFRGLPENPSPGSWPAAKNRALEVLRCELTARTYEPELSRFLQNEWTLAPVVEKMFSDTAIKDDQLRRMFSCRHPVCPRKRRSCSSFKSYAKKKRSLCAIHYIQVAQWQSYSNGRGISLN
jgi:predicted RNA polymerase sigma factor